MFLKPSAQELVGPQRAGDVTGCGWAEGAGVIILDRVGDLDGQRINDKCIGAARELSKTFYGRLAEHGAVDLALNEARSTLLTAGRPDAAVSVLFMRLKSGQVWSAEADALGQVLGSPNPRVFWTGLLRNIQQGQVTPIIGPRVHGEWLPTPVEIAGWWAMARVPNRIWASLTDNALLFVGFSLDDWEFRVVLHGLVATRDRRRKLKHVGVQLEMKGAGETETEAAQTFLQQYFQEADINIYCGAPAQFIAELREQMESAPAPAGKPRSAMRRAVAR